MRPQLLMFCFGVFMIGTMLSAIISGRWLIDDEVSLFNALASFNVAEMQGAGGAGMVKHLKSYWDALVTMLSWKYPYLNNDWGRIFKMVFLFPLSVGVVYGFIQLFVIAMSGVVSAIRSLLPGAG